MITSIFSKSKPINFLVVFFVTLLAFLLANIKLQNEPVVFSFIIEKIIIFSICYLSILTLNFIVGKNSLTHKSNFEILLYCLFLLMIPQTLLNDRIIVSNFFILLALRRILSLRSQINLKKKLFDASFWIAIASLFYFWAILFFVLIFVVLMLYTDNKIRNWIVPFAGLTTVFLISTSYSVLFYDDFFEAFNISFKTSFDFSDYNSPKYIIAITILLSFGIWSSIFYLKAVKTKLKKYRPVLKAIFVMMLIAFTIVIIAPAKAGSEFLFLFPPLAVIVTNYIEMIQEKWFKELFLLVLIIAPFILLML